MYGLIERNFKNPGSHKVKIMRTFIEKYSSPKVSCQNKTYCMTQIILNDLRTLESVILLA